MADSVNEHRVLDAVLRFNTALNVAGTVHPCIGASRGPRTWFAVGAARAVEDGETLVRASRDGGFLMGLSEVETLVSAASSAVVVIYNDAAYGAPDGSGSRRSPGLYCLIPACLSETTGPTCQGGHYEPDTKTACDR